MYKLLLIARISSKFNKIKKAKWEVEKERCVHMYLLPCHIRMKVKCSKERNRNERYFIVKFMWFDQGS